MAWECSVRFGQKHYVRWCWYSDDIIVGCSSSCVAMVEKLVSHYCSVSTKYYKPQPGTL